MKKVFSALLCALLLLGFCACGLDFSDVADAAFSREAQEEMQPGDFTAVFLSVGQGDCTLFASGNEYMLIDCGDLDAFSHVSAVLRQYGAGKLRYFVATHDHSDHVGAAGALLREFEVEEILHSPLTVSDSGHDYGRMFAEAQEQKIPARAVTAGDSFTLGEAQVRVLAPPLSDPASVNNSSVVLKITCGGFSFLLAADAERESEREMLLSGESLGADVLRVGHHGSASSTSYSFLRGVMPQYAVISVGAGNSYGHPAEAVLSRLSDCACTIYRTDAHGDICFRAREGALSVTTEISEPAFLPENPEPLQEIYIGNRKSKIFHTPDCKNLPAEQNRVEFPSAQEAIEAGYSPCKSCNP